MSKLPAVRPSDLARVARKIGFVLDRQRGSHAVYYREADRRRVVIPMHHRDLKAGTLHGILDDMGMTREQLISLL
jgi:predicted RNA binding protein YcfA (HicA-like mRNA interferase family)